MELDLARMRATFESVPELLVLVDVHDLTVLALNRVGRELVGGPPAGGSVAQWPHPLGRRLLERLEQVRATGDTFRVSDWRLAWTRADGASVESRLEVTVRPLLDERGTPWSLLGSAREVSAGTRPRGPDPAAEPAAEPAADPATGAEADIVAAVQDAVLPTSLPVPQGAQLAARYLLAQDGRGAGGDWFDAIPLADGGVVLVVGDVVGHGVEAAMLAADLKAAFEEVVRRDGDLVAALEVLDARADRYPQARATTLAVARFDPSTAVLEYVTAGHPPPVLVPAIGEAAYLAPSGAGPLASGLPFAVARRQLAERDVVLLYSDGLMERPGRTAAQDTVELMTVAGDAVRNGSDEPAVDRVCDSVLTLITGSGGYDDDIALLAMQAVPPVEPLQLRLPAAAGTVRAVRAGVDDWLGRLGVSALDRTAVQQAVGELVTNAVEHAYPSPDPADPVTVDVRLSPDGVVELEVRDQGAWQQPDARAQGRGLSMAHRFLDSLRVDHGPGGTCVHGRYRVSRPASLLRGTSTARARAHRSPGEIAVDDGVLRLTGAMDHDRVDDLRAALTLASFGGVRPVTVELAGADLLSSAVVQALYDARAAGPLELVAPLGSVAQQVLDLVGLSYVDR